MNVRQQLYKKFRIDGCSKYSAARKAGYSHNSAIAAGRNIEKRINMDQCLELVGLTDRALAKHAVDGMAANKVVSAVIVGKDATDKTDDFIDVPDWGVRHRYFDTILKLRGKLKNGHSIEVKVDNSQHFTRIEIKDLEDKSDRDLTDLILGRVNAGAIKGIG